MLSLSFDQGTLLLDGPDAAAWAVQFGFQHDDRSGQWRAEAIRYREIVLGLRNQKVLFEDRARKYGIDHRFGHSLQKNGPFLKKRNRQERQELLGLFLGALGVLGGFFSYSFQQETGLARHPLAESFGSRWPRR